jgi:hypothetical protein
MPKDRIRTVGKLRAWTAAFAVVIAGMAASASAAQALPRNFWGVDPQATPTAEQLQRLKRGGVSSVRISIAWNAIQPERGGAFNWSGVDAQVGADANAGLDTLPAFGGAPAWAVPSVRVPGGGHTKAPSHLPASGAAGAGWSSFLSQAVARYGPNGTFWAENPAIPPRPIRTWQVWNEENFKYFVTMPNPAEYGRLVKLSSTAIKSVDPSAQVILGGMFARPKGGQSKAKPKRNYFATDFLEQMYEKTPGIKAKFNGVALHPYSYYFQELGSRIEELRAVMAANHDAGKGLWITEVGWSSQPPTHSNLFAKGVGGQKTQLEGAFKLLRSKQQQWRIKQVDWFSVDDQTGSCNFCDGSGLFREGFIPKPAWYAYARFAGGTP